MAVSLVSTGVQFPDSTIQTTAASVSGVTTATASGTISSNVPVIVNSDGTVSSITGGIASAGSLTQSSTTSRVGGLYAYDATSGKTLHIATSGTPTAYVITLSGNTISYGTGNSFASNVGYMYSLVSIGNSKFLVCWVDTSQMLYTAVLTISGTTVSVGTATAIQASSSNFASVGYNPALDKAFIAYAYSSGVVGAVLSISGTTITASGYANISTSVGNPSLAYDSTIQKLVVAYINQSNSYLEAKVVTISGTTFSTGTAATIASSVITTPMPRMAYNEQTQTMLYYVQYSYNVNPYIVASTQSGTTITFGSYSSVSGFTTYLTNNNQATIFYMSTVGKVCLVGPYNTGSLGLCYKLLSNSGTTVTQETIVVISTNQQTYYNPLYGASWDTTNKKAVAYAVDTATNTPQSIAFNPDYTNLTSENYIGLSSASYTNGQTATVQIVGAINTSQTGLTAGKKYYVQPDGTLSTTAGSPSVYAGVATASTKLIVKG